MINWESRSATWAIRFPYLSISLLAYENTSGRSRAILSVITNSGNSGVVARSRVSVGVLAGVSCDGNGGDFVGLKGGIVGSDFVGAKDGTVGGDVSVRFGVIDVSVADVVAVDVVSVAVVSVVNCVVGVVSVSTIGVNRAEVAVIGGSINIGDVGADDIVGVVGADIIVGDIVVVVVAVVGGLGDLGVNCF